jgi:hypothetical protein|tara:strand:- start:2974 stop:3264 length:291 start_codon:yes stop_codon:yes gene_type:complete
MAVYILIGIDPLAQPGVHSIFKYTTLKESHDHVAAWLHDTLTLQSRLLCGLKGTIGHHIQKYMAEFVESNYINFYGEYPGKDLSGQYEYKWEVYTL